MQHFPLFGGQRADGPFNRQTLLQLLVRRDDRFEQWATAGVAFSPATTQRAVALVANRPTQVSLAPRECGRWVSGRCRETPGAQRRGRPPNPPGSSPRTDRTSRHAGRTAGRSSRSDYRPASGMSWRHDQLDANGEGFCLRGAGGSYRRVRMRAGRNARWVRSAAWRRSPIGRGHVRPAQVGRPGRTWRLSMKRPKIIFPAVVCSTLVTTMSMVLPIRRRALSTTTIVPSSR